MNKKTALVLAAALGFASSPASAAVNVPVPATDYITQSGLDWAWAAPCAAYGSSCGPVDLSYQSTQGWRFPTLQEFLARPTATDFGNKCASAYFGSYQHCDFGDPEAGGVNSQGQPMGYLFDYGYNITQNGSSPVADSWVVRGALSANNGVPEPATWAMMLFGFGAVGFGMRRRRGQRSDEARVRFAV